MAVAKEMSVKERLIRVETNLEAVQQSLGELRKDLRGLVAIISKTAVAPISRRSNGWLKIAWTGMWREPKIILILVVAIASGSIGLSLMPIVETFQSILNGLS